MLLRRDGAEVETLPPRAGSVILDTTMAVVRTLLRDGGHGLPEPDGRREAALLLQHVLGVSAAWLVVHADASIDPSRAGAYRDLVARRSTGEPVAYLTGTRGFHALDVHVTPDVLIPRPETELLVDLVLQRIAVDAASQVADLGTGSGAIALALARARPRARVFATDASAAALQVARGNAERLGLGNVEFRRGDWCAALADQKFDVIAANPPYIAAGDPHLARGDLRFEPRAALVSGGDGLDAIRVISRGARAHLAAGGWLLLEHGWDQGAAVDSLLQRYGYRDVFTARDSDGRERVGGGRVGPVRTGRTR